MDLTTDMGEVKPGYYQQTSAPLVAGNRVVVGSRVADNYATGEPPGVVRAFNVHSGALVWAWDPGNPAITRAPPPGATYTRGTPNVWSAMSFDSKLNTGLSAHRQRHTGLFRRRTHQAGRQIQLIG